MSEAKDVKDDERPWRSPWRNYRVVEVKDGRRTVMPYYDNSKMFAKHRYVEKHELGCPWFTFYDELAYFKSTTVPFPLCSLYLGGLDRMLRALLTC